MVWSISHGGGVLYSPIVDWLVTVTMPTIDKSQKNNIIIKRSSDVTCTELYHHTSYPIQLSQQTYLVPRVSSLYWIEKNSDDLSFWQQSMSPQWCYFAVKIICALLKQDGVALVGNIRKEIHIPTRTQITCIHLSFVFVAIFFFHLL